MFEDMMPMPCIAERGGGQKMVESNPEAFVSKVFINAMFHCCKKIVPALTDGSSGTYIANSKKRRVERCRTDFCDEQVLALVAKHSNWNPFLLCLLSCLCKKTKAISDRHLWREFCRSRAPKMVADLLVDVKNNHIDGGWRALGKLFLYCPGCYKSNLGSYCPREAVPGHFVPKTRFSCTSGKFFLIPCCRSDVLYVSDPCEHANSPEDVGVFRGVFRKFDKSKTKKFLALKRVPLSEDEKCPFCKAGVWSMKRAKMIPKSASTRLAAYNENVDYSVCLNGHLRGRCALLHLSDSDGSDEDE